MDLRRMESEDRAAQADQGVDVLVRLPAWNIEEMGFGYERLKTLNPRMIMVNVSAYGQFGPYRVRSATTPSARPCRIAMVTGEAACADSRRRSHHRPHHPRCNSAIGTLAALYERSISGEGQSIDVCLRLRLQLTRIPITAYHGPDEPRRGVSDSAPSGMYPCKDGWVLTCCG